MKGAEEVQPHTDDGDARHDRERIGMRAQKIADCRGAGAERDEDGGEAEDEKERGRQFAARDQWPGLARDQMLECGAGEEAEIRRHQRQHAGRNEADEPRDKGGWNGDIGHGAVLPPREAEGKQRQGALASF